MLDVEEATGLGAIDDLVEGVGFRRGWVGVEGHVFGREEVMVVGGIDAASLVADVFIGGAAVLGGGGVVVLSEWDLGADGEISCGGFGRGVGLRGFGRERKRVKEG